MNNPLTDVMAQNISYERGTLFWAEMDARIRAASNGAAISTASWCRSLRALDRPEAVICREQPSNRVVHPGELVDSLAKGAGPSARQLFDSVIVRGKNIVPTPNAFGPCFELRPARYQGRYLGSNAARQAAIGLPPAPDIDAYLWFRVRRP
jgi:predicted metalloprotease with PDZ domain